jgi:hypothetical protein
VNHDQPSISSHFYQLAHEITLCVNLAITVVAFIFLFQPSPVASALLRMDVFLSRSFHIISATSVPKDYFTAGYFAFALPAIALAAGLVILLRAFCPAAFRTRFLISFGGFSAMAALPVYWLSSTYVSTHRYGWSLFRAVQFYELFGASIWLLLLLRRKRPYPFWSNIFAILLHFTFWFRQFGTFHAFSGAWGPILLLPVVGLVAALAWALYLREVAREQLSGSVLRWNTESAPTD